MIVTLYGLVAVGFMMTMYALEHVHRRFVLAFAVGCLLSSGYGFLSGAWPFGIVEAIWAVIAVRRFQSDGDPSATPTDPPLAAASPVPEAAGDAPVPSRLTSSANPSTVGEPLTFVARLGHPASGTPARAITFGVGLVVLATVPVDGDGTAQLTTSELPAGHHLVTASVDGGTTGSARPASLEQVVMNSSRPR